MIQAELFGIDSAGGMFFRSLFANVDLVVFLSVASAHGIGPRRWDNTCFMSSLRVCDMRIILAYKCQSALRSICRPPA